jgi:hypothetical protein
VRNKPVLEVVERFIPRGRRYSTCQHCPGSEVDAPRTARSHIGELGFAHHARATVDLALDLVLKHAGGLGQLANDDKNLTAVTYLAHLRRKADLLTTANLCAGIFSLIDFHGAG